MTRAAAQALLRDASLPSYSREVGGELPLDRWISYAVKVLRDGGIETYESCQGGPGHCFPEPTVRFHGGPGEGHRALALALTFGLPAFTVRRFWQVLGTEPHGPHWEITFYPLAKLKAIQREAERAGLIE